MIVFLAQDAIESEDLDSSGILFQVGKSLGFSRLFEKYEADFSISAVWLITLPKMLLRI